MLITNGNVFDGRGFATRDVAVADGRFVEAADVGDGDVLDAAGCYVIPGLVDVHFHGCLGADLCDGTGEALSTIARHEASRGVTAICPATMTYPEEKLAGIMRAAAAFAPTDNEAALVGVNMEGPFI